MCHNKDMKKKIFPGLLLAIAALGMIFFGCDLFMSESPVSSSTYEPLVIMARGLNGEEAEIEFSTTRTGPRGVLTPQTGDSYVLRRDGAVISRGTIQVDEIHIIFHPSNGAASFVGSYTRGDGYIVLFEIPDENGELPTGPSSPGGGASGGGGGAGGGSTRPSYDVVARSPAAVIGVFGNNAVGGAGNAVNLKGDTRRVTSNVAIYVPIVVAREGSGSVKLTIDSRNEVMIAGTGSLTVKEGEELIITGGGTLRIAGAALNVSGENAKLTVDPGTTLIITNEGTKLPTLNINDNGELAVNGGDIDIYTAVSVRSTAAALAAAPTALATLKVTSGNVNVYSGGYLTIGGGGVFELGASSSTRPPRLIISGTGVVEITEDGAWTSPDTVPANKYKSVTLSGGGEFIVPSGDSTTNNQTTLTAAIAAIKQVDRGTGYQGRVVVKLTEKFYASATTTITVDSGISSPSNSVPYTIRGLGKNTTKASEILNVGIWLANDNITLEDVKIKIDSASTSNTTAQYWSPSSNYQTAVLIGRDNGSPSNNTKPVSKNVTVRNSSITISGAGLSAGIIVGGYRGESGDNIITTNAGAQNITIADNTVVAANTNNGAVVGLMIYIWEDSIRVTGNDLKARYGGTGDPGTIAAPNGSPAAAFFINRVNEGRDFTGNSSIAGNTLHGTTPAERYSFFINAMMPTTASNIISTASGTALAIADLRTQKFGTKDSTWVAQGSGVHKKLYNALLGNVTNGLGLFSMLVYQGTYSDYVLESYNIVDKKTTYISYWGYEIPNVTQGYLVTSSREKRGGYTIPLPTTITDDTGPYNGAEGDAYRNRYYKNPSTKDT